MAQSIDTIALQRQIENKAQGFINACVGAAAARAIELTPVEYSTLRNSQFTNVVKATTGFRGTVGYGVYYAKYLNGLPGYRTPTWSPRPISEKRGPATNMNAEPQFLDKGFERAAPDFERYRRIFFGQ